ncbi:hypothetical protein MCUN1_002217 [Malassezia cuniculi]|uniref:Kinesin-like protein n=1 Tax=Malassezia cuniculi TaxID=948313 RepID=A0AAF0EZB7_9BASI|nr:hypothetical protein MCUN1_002217 [Malassezia cuniculi]
MSVRAHGRQGSAAVQPAVRIRPGERSRSENVPRPLRTVVHAQGAAQLVVDQGDSRHSFAYDTVYGEHAGQAGVFDASVAPLVDEFLSGHNVTVLAYGQTSSGKSYTMGTADVPHDEATLGIIPRAAQRIIAQLAGHEYALSASFLELYNEELIDLLTDPSVESPPVQIRENRGQIIWTGVRQLPVTTAAGIVESLRRGMVYRQTHETQMNTHSSRSHAIFTLSLRRGAGTPRRSALPVARTPHARSSPLRAEPQTVSKLHFVDLAGSERLKRTAATGERAREGIAINAGLHALGNVISTLADPTRRTAHIPYRDSKLTRLLQDSLGGNAYTLMIACVSPLEANVFETLNTLQYAQRARHIRNTVVQNVVPDSVEELQAEVQRLRAALDERDVFGEQPLPDAVDWQRRYMELSQQNVRLTAELARRDREAADRAAEQADFLAAAEPVIVEYEKTVDALEGEIALMKAALAHSEGLIEEKDRALAEAEERHKETTVQMDILRDTVHKLTERLAERTRRVGELEEAQSVKRTFSLRRWSGGCEAGGSRRSFGGILEYHGARNTRRSFLVAKSPGRAASRAADDASSGASAGHVGDDAYGVDGGAESGTDSGSFYGAYYAYSSADVTVEHGDSTQNTLADDGEAGGEDGGISYNTPADDGN